MCEHGKQFEMPFNVISTWEEGFIETPNNKEYWKKDKRGHFIKIDACLAYQVWKMNTQLEIRTTSCCCRHGQGLHDDEGQILIDCHSVHNAVKNGYDVRIYHRIWDRPDGAELEQPTYEIRI